MTTLTNSSHELAALFNPFGILDLKAACAIGDELSLHEKELFDIIDETRENYGLYNFENIDPVASVLEYILQMARNKIEAVTGYDFLNDLTGGDTEIYTYGNYLCSSYDYSEEAREALEKAVTPYLTELTKDKWCHYFLSELNIGAN